MQEYLVIHTAWTLLTAMFFSIYWSDLDAKFVKFFTAKGKPYTEFEKNAVLSTTVTGLSLLGPMIIVLVVLRYRSKKNRIKNKS